MDGVAKKINYLFMCAFFFIAIPFFLGPESVGLF